MAVNINNAFVGTPPIDGGVYFNAPIDTPLPTSAEADLDKSVWVDHGAIGPDGFNVQPTRTSDTEKMFGGGDWVDTQTDYTEEVTLTFLEDDNAGVIASIFGDDNVVTKAGAEGTEKTIYHTKQRLPIKSHVLKAVDGDKTNLYIIERGQVVSVGERRVAHSDVTRTEVTIRAYKSTAPELKGANVVELRHNPNDTASSTDE